MDPKTANLDPKLKEAYDRVMGTSTPGTSPTAPAQPATPAAPAQPASPAASPASAPASPAAGPAASPTAPIISAIGMKEPITDAPKVTPTTPTASVSSVFNSTSFVASTNTQAKKHSGVSTKLLFFAAIVFFLVYGLFWMRYFNVAIPFLPF